MLTHIPSLDGIGKHRHKQLILNTLQQRLSTVKQRIRSAAEKYDRRAADIQLLAVSKTRPVEEIIALFESGQKTFGENYLQDALDKIEATRELPLEWHFIGPVQSNKTRRIAGHFDWLHSLDRLKIAQRLSEQRTPWQPPLNVCVQVNINSEPGKSGVPADNVPELCRAVTILPNLRLRGLMAIPGETSDFDAQRRNFRSLRELKNRLVEQGLDLDTLSMGMSGDLEAAIAEGATIVRVGIDIFGPR